MWDVIERFISQYGIIGALIGLAALACYLIWGDRKNHWGDKIDNLCDKVDNVNDKIETVEEKLSTRMDGIESKMNNLPNERKMIEKNEAREQTANLMNTSFAGRVSKVLKYFCQRIEADHIFIGSFHNGSSDLRGLHYCKFDILTDEFVDPLHLHENDIDFQPLYKDVNIMAYGDLPYKLVHVDTVIFDLVKDEEMFLDLSDTLYRRCKSRDIKQIGFAVVRDRDGFATGFIGCVKYDDGDMVEEELKGCLKAIENIYDER